MTSSHDTRENGNNESSSQHGGRQHQDVPSGAGCIVVATTSRQGRRTRSSNNIVRFDETVIIYEYEKVTENEKSFVWYNRREEELMHRRRWGDRTQSTWEEWMRAGRRHRCRNNNINKKHDNNDLFIRTCIILGILWIIFDSLTTNTTTTTIQPTKMHLQVVKIDNDEGIFDGSSPPSSRLDEL